MTTQRFRFAFDLGTNSIGWAVYTLDREPGPDVAATVTSLLGCGVRLFDDGRNPKDGNSLAEMRRVPRSARRRRDRYLERRTHLLALLTDLGLMPADVGVRKKVVALDPYALRARGLDEALSPHELGRALMHLNQRRGFKSNRRADRRGDGKEKGKIAEGAHRLKEGLASENARTFGELLWRRHGGADGTATPRERKGVRIRLEGEGAKALYDIYPTREMLEQEFDLILARQREFNPEMLTEATTAELKRAIFFQRPLKQVEPGRCTLVPTEPRLPKALPSVEERVVYESLNHLRFGIGVTRDAPLTKEQRDLVAAMLLQGRTGKSVSFDSLRSGLKLATEVRFSLEDAGKSGLDDYASKSAKALGDKKRFGQRWLTLPLDERDGIVARLIGSEDTEQIQEWLVREYQLTAQAAAATATWQPREREQALGSPDRFGSRWGELSSDERAAIVRRLTGNEDEGEIVTWLRSAYRLDNEAALAIARWAPREGVSRLGKTANIAILDELRADVITYDDAVKRAGWDHSVGAEKTKPFLPLPYYGQIIERHVAFGSGNPEDPAEKRYGRISNPTVHIGLGQLRRLVNALARMYGEPSQIVIELARDLKLSREQKEKESRENASNKKLNDARRKQLEELGQDDTGENRLRLRLFEEQQRANKEALCPYSLKTIGIASLFSAEVEIDHILPYSRTLDDTKANRILCYRAANRMKRRQTPHEAFADASKTSPGVPAWDDIVAAAAGLPANKRWRFGADAMERFEKRERNFLARQINETRHLSRLARLYLGAATGTTDQVYVATGQLTAMLRARWGLNTLLGDENRKVRTDHRHHAIDAITIGAIDRSLLQEMARRAGVAEEEGREGITKDVPDPPAFEGKFRDAARAAIANVVISVKPEHGKGGALHEDTAYGLITNPQEAAEIGNLVFRKPLADLNVNEIDRVRDASLRSKLKELAGVFCDGNGKLRDEKGLKQALASFRIREQIGDRIIDRQVRRVRIGKAKSGEVHVRDRRTGAVYKALLPGENHHIDIVQMRDGIWRGFPATVFEVNQQGWRPVWERERMGGKLVMRVHKGDMIEVDCDGGQRRLMTIHRLSPSNNVLYLAPHTEGGALQKRHDDKDDLFRWDFANIGGLKKRNARKVKVDVAGRLTYERSNV